MRLIASVIVALVAGAWFAGAARAGDTRSLERIIEHELDTGESRVLSRSERPLSAAETRRDLQITGQRLDTLKTRAPQAPAVPLLERQYDRSRRALDARGSRPSGLGLTTRSPGGRRWP